MNYTHIKNDERVLIEYLFYQEFKSIRQIAFDLNRSPSTISRELKRNNLNGAYWSPYANLKAKSRFIKKRFFGLLKYQEFTKQFEKYFEKNYHGVRITYNKICQLFPQIKKPSWRQVYNWIKNSKWFIKRSDLVKRKYRKRIKSLIRIFSKFKNKYVMPIWVRPNFINNREQFGHWEADLIIGNKANGYSNLLTLTERKTRMNFIAFAKTKNPMQINQIIKKMIKENHLLVKSITIDNGIEFAKIGLLAYWVKCKIYYCEPYASYQRGSNEHINGMIRRIWKKKTDFSLLSIDDLMDVQNKINNMPRKMFNWKSSSQIYKELS